MVSYHPFREPKEEARKEEESLSSQDKRQIPMMGSEKILVRGSKINGIL